MDTCPIAYDHDLDGADCAVCGWSPAKPVVRMDPQERESVRAWIAVLNDACAGEIPDVEDEWTDGGLAEPDVEPMTYQQALAERDEMR